MSYGEFTARELQTLRRHRLLTSEIDLLLGRTNAPGGNFAPHRSDEQETIAAGMFPAIRRMYLKRKAAFERLHGAPGKEPHSMSADVPRRGIRGVPPDLRL